MSDHIEPGRSRSQGDDCIDLILDEAEGDFTVRPCRPELRAAAVAEREKLIKHGLLKLPDQPKPDEQK